MTVEIIVMFLTFAVTILLTALLPTLLTVITWRCDNLVVCPNFLKLNGRRALAPAPAVQIGDILTQLILSLPVLTILLTALIERLTTPLQFNNWWVTVQGTLDRLTRILLVLVVRVTLTWLPTTRGILSVPSPAPSCRVSLINLVAE